MFILPFLQMETTFVTSCLLTWMTYLKWGLLLKKRIFSIGANSFLEELTLSEKGDKN